MMAAPTHDISRAVLLRELQAALEAATHHLLDDRACYRESITTTFGAIPDPDDRASLAELDNLVDRCNAALEKAKAVLR